MQIHQGVVRGERPARQEKTGSGFTLVETMVALTILAFGLLAMLGMMSAALKGGQVGRHATDASRLARNKLEFFNRLDWADPNLAPTAGWQNDPAAATTNFVTNQYGVQQEQVYGLQFRIAPDPLDTDLRLIDVRVTWREGDDSLAVPNRRIAMSSVRFNNP